ncbi:hypothetical protein ACK1LH_09860 [Metabacillus indicus]|uniref:hypothetical protein n=1 Tax=Metabacillus indicus TaxID=246786 RepID=UPI00398422D3
MGKKKNPQLKDLVKKAGFQLESNLNHAIKEKINDKDFSRLVFNTQKKTELQKLLGNFSSAHNLPSKDDVANTAKLVIKTEEKIDSIEEKLLEIDAKLNEMKSLVQQNKKK